jgi:hypothetical protein
MKRSGWLPDPFDDRDYAFSDLSVGGNLRDFESLKGLITRIYDQGNTNSCVAQAISLAYGIRDVVETGRHNPPLSRLFLYYNARAYLNRQWRDLGCQPRLAMRGLQKLGVPAEEYWPWSTSALTVRRQPNWRAYAHAYRNRNLTYRRIGTDRLYEIKAAITMGKPVIAGLEISKAFMKSAGKSVIGTPQKKDVTGRHMVCIVGYSPDGVTIANSWGTDWGKRGFGVISNEYIESERVGDIYALG